MPRVHVDLESRSFKCFRSLALLLLGDLLLFGFRVRVRVGVRVGVRVYGLGRVYGWG